MSKEIKSKIDMLNHQLEEVTTPFTFSLNHKAEQIMNQINSLQHQCSHHYVNGICEYCYKEEQ